MDSDSPTESADYNPRTGAVIENRGNKLAELQAMAKARNIETTVIEEDMKEGYEGVPKGMLQILWERGWIDKSKWRSTGWNPARMTKLMSMVKWWKVPRKGFITSRISC